MIELLLKFGLSIFELILSFQFCNCYLKIRNKNNKVIRSVKIIVLAITSMFINIVFVNVIINIVVSILVILIVLLEFEGKAIQKSFIGAIYVGFSMMLELLVALVTEILYGNQRIVIEKESIILFFALSVTYLLKYIIIFYLKSIRKAFVQIENTSIYLKQMIVPILSIEFVSYFIYCQLQMDFIDYQLCYIVLAVFAAINIVLYSIYENTEKLYISNYNNMLLNESLEYKESYYQNVEKHQAEIHMIRHNLKNQLIAIQGEIEEEHIQEAQREINHIIQDILHTEEQSYTENVPINAILNAKEAEAREKGIQCDFQVSVPNKIKLTGGDIGILFGNTLDNAIEASSKCEEIRKIHLEADYYGNYMNILIENTTAEKVESLLTQKKNKQEHGWGLVSVETIVKRYDGKIDTESGEHLFSISITLWNV
ncbi:MAG: GHKL domain-containing protein [Lachnospiraceae bacterium]|nr:GHKL domain-containing protein [Lachnospiraceae bacterium]